MKILLAVHSLLITFSMAAPSYAGKTEKFFPSVPGELVVKLASEPNQKSNLTFERVAQDLQRRLGLKRVIQVRHFITHERFAVLKLSGADLKSAQTVLDRDPRVAYAEPNYLYHIIGNRTAGTVSPNDAQFNQLWGLKNTGQVDAAGQAGTPGSDIHVSSVWDEGVTGSKKIKVAVIDTGVDYTHPDLAPNVDASLGYNFAEGKPDAKDDHDHGSHCAGTIGAVANNGVGVAGINWNVTIVPIKFLDSQGSGSLDKAVQAVQWATQQRVNIMSNSWGGGGFSQALYDAIADARDHGITFVAAAGNDSNDNDATPSYPASYDLPNVISVAATDQRDQIALFSNYGRTKVHVAAPGVEILSTAKDGGYAIFSGTSMATPHVSGIAALMLSVNPSLTYEQIKDTLIRSSDKVRSLSRKVIAKGRVNADHAIHGIFPVDPTPDESLWQDFAFTIESPHPYENSNTYSYSIRVPNAKYIRVVFDQVDTEAGYDVISVKDSTGQTVEAISGSLTNYVSEYIEGSTASLVFTTDYSVNKTGFKVGKLQYQR